MNMHGVYRRTKENIQFNCAGCWDEIFSIFDISQTKSMIDLSQFYYIFYV